MCNVERHKGEKCKAIEGNFFDWNLIAKILPFPFSFFIFLFFADFPTIFPTHNLFSIHCVVCVYSCFSSLTRFSFSPSVPGVELCNKENLWEKSRKERKIFIEMQSKSKIFKWKLKLSAPRLFVVNGDKFVNSSFSPLCCEGIFQSQWFFLCYIFPLNYSFSGLLLSERNERK